MDNTLTLIRTKDNAGIDFFNWLSEHTEITNIQGYNIERRENGSVSAFYFGSYVRHMADVDWLYSERAMLNDWIKSYLHSHKDD